jgi:hypothetical protein
VCEGNPASGVLALDFITLLLKAYYSWYLLAPKQTNGGLDDRCSGVSWGSSYGYAWLDIW